jgi:hypothetical protein
MNQRRRLGAFSEHMECRLVLSPEFLMPVAPIPVANDDDAAEVAVESSPVSLVRTVSASSRRVPVPVATDRGDATEVEIESTQRKQSPAVVEVLPAEPELVIVQVVDKVRVTRNVGSVGRFELDDITTVTRPQKTSQPVAVRDVEQTLEATLRVQPPPDAAPVRRVAETPSAVAVTSTDATPVSNSSGHLTTRPAEVDSTAEPARDIQQAAVRVDRVDDRTVSDVPATTSDEVATIATDTKTTNVRIRATTVAASSASIEVIERAAVSTMVRPTAISVATEVAPSATIRETPVTELQGDDSRPIVDVAVRSDAFAEPIDVLAPELEDESSEAQPEVVAVDTEAESALPAIVELEAGQIQHGDRPTDPALQIRTDTQRGWSDSPTTKRSVIDAAVVQTLYTRYRTPANNSSLLASNLLATTPLLNFEQTANHTVFGEATRLGLMLAAVNHMGRRSGSLVAFSDAADEVGNDGFIYSKERRRRRVPIGRRMPTAFERLRRTTSYLETVDERAAIPNANPSSDLLFANAAMMTVLYQESENSSDDSADKFNWMLGGLAASLTGLAAGRAGQLRRRNNKSARPAPVPPRYSGKTLVFAD